MYDRPDSVGCCRPYRRRLGLLTPATRYPLPLGPRLGAFFDPAPPNPYA
jgi:hypothetical protein